jgi:hypothetical protein
VKSDVTDLLSTIHSMYCPFRAIKSKIPRKDYGKTKIPLISYKYFLYILEISDKILHNN